MTIETTPDQLNVQHEVEAAAAHPLDPLSTDEIADAVAIVKADARIAEGIRFVMVTLQEPAKPPDLVFDLVNPPERVSKVIAYSKAEHLIIEIVLSLTTSTVLSVTPVPGKFPSVLTEEFSNVEELVRANLEWQAAVQARGVTDFSLAMIDPWPSGFTGPSDDPSNGRRMVRPLTFLRSSPGEHGYARPVEGLIVTVDLDAMEVIDVADHGVVPLPAHPGNYDGGRMFDPMNRPAFTEFRSDLKPIDITQPEGPSFTVDGWAVSWQKWSFRVGFTRIAIDLKQAGTCILNADQPAYRGHAAAVRITHSFEVTVPSPVTPPVAPNPVSLTSTGPGGVAQNATVALAAGNTVTLLDGGQPASSVTVSGVGTYSVNATSGVITFTPVPGYLGTPAGVTFRVTDSGARSGTATYTPTVTLPAAPAPGLARVPVLGCSIRRFPSVTARRSPCWTLPARRPVR